MNNWPDINAGDFYRNARSVARQYGFESATSVFQKHAIPRGILPMLRELDPTDGELANGIAGFSGNDSVLREPISFYRTNLERRDTDKSASVVVPRNINFSLHIIGSRESIAEAMVLKTALAIIERMGIKNTSVYINSIGDKDSSGKFARELGNYLKKHTELLGERQELLREDVFRALEYVIRRRREIRTMIPKPADFLSIDSRRHLREVLEFLEVSELPYEIDDSLIGSRDCFSHTLFEIRNAVPDESEEEDLPIARGGRYDELSKRMGKSTIPAVGIIFSFNPEKRSLLRPTRIRDEKPMVCFINVGFDAQVRSLNVADRLHKGRVAFYQPLLSGGLSDKLVKAEKLNIPYAIIMGQKEAMEGSVIVRDLRTRAQETIPLDLLVSYIKTLPKKR